jgi:tetratricopeptide (TPR) repeat protein
MERGLSNLGKLLAEREFESEAEINEFLESMLAETGGQIPQRAPASPLEQAQNLMYDAWEAAGSRRVKLARQALQISPDCADAYVLLAEETAQSPREALQLYQQGVDAGRRALGPDAFEEAVGHFWGVTETRPYMRARAGLAECLVALGQWPDAIAHYQEMLRLNPGDNQGLRYNFLTLLLAAGELTQAADLLDQYTGDISAAWTYSCALLAFARHGDSDASRLALAAARTGNPHIPAYLAGSRRIPRYRPPYVGIGDEAEAIWYAQDHRYAWLATPGAVDWLKRANANETTIDRVEVEEGPGIFLHPYIDAAFTRCPHCETPTKVRKVYLVISLASGIVLVLNKSCRLCEPCNVLIVRQYELEDLMAAALEESHQDAIGQAYSILGTLDKSDGRRVARGDFDAAWALERVKVGRDYRLTELPGDL